MIGDSTQKPSGGLDTTINPDAHAESHVARIYLKSGTVIEVRVREMTAERDMDGNLISLKWVLPDASTRILHLNLREVAAAITTRAPEVPEDA